MNPPPRFHVWSTAVASAVLLALASCAKAPPQAAPPEAVAESNRERTVSVYSWEDYFSPAVCEQFEKETGIRIEWHYFMNLGQMNGMLRSQPEAYDVIVLDDMSLGELIELQLLRPLQKEQLPNLSHIDPRYLDLAFDPGNRYSVPYMWGTTLLAYRKDRIANPEQSWELLWKTGLDGRIHMINERQDAYSIVLLSMGKDLNSSDPADLEAATERLLKQAREVGVAYTDLESLKEKLISGDCLAAPLYSGDAALIASENENIGFFIPREGAPLWLDSFAIPRESRNVEEAMAFMDYMSRPEVAAANANHLSYATANRSALPLLSPELRNDPSVFPPEDVLSRCGFIRKANQERDTITNRGMKRIFDLIHKRDASQPAQPEAAATGGSAP